MSELIQGLVHVRGGLSLIAFLSLVMLFAFRTKKVPELFFAVVRDKLTRQQFAALLNRFMTLILVVFLTLASLAAMAQVFNFITQPGGLTVSDLRSELAKLDSTEEQKIKAEAQYKLALERLEQRDFDKAIESLKASIQAIPTLTAQEMVAYLYRQKRDFESASKAWERAMKTARENGNAVASVRLDRISDPSVQLDLPGENDLIGDRAPLPKGGTNFETAPVIGPGLYGCLSNDGCLGRWFTVDLKTGESLKVKLRSPATGGLAGAGIYGTNGQFLKGAGDGLGTMRGNAGAGSSIYETEWIAQSSGKHFIRIGADRGTVYRFYVR